MSLEAWGTPPDKDPECCPNCGSGFYMHGCTHCDAVKAKCEANRQALVLRCQVDSLKASLLKVLDTREAEAKASLTYETAKNNYSSGSWPESRRHLRTMMEASHAEKEARLLLATLKPPNGKLSGPQGR